MKPQTKPRSDIKKVLNDIFKRGVTPEQMACDLNVSYGAVKSWQIGIRNPKKPRLLKMEAIYGVKVL